MKDYYDILEVNPKASKEVIDKAYKVLIKKYHPDLYTGEDKVYAQRKTIEINEAYHVLANSFMREQYDNELQKEFARTYAYGENQYQQEQPEEELSRKERKKKKKRESKSQIGTLSSLMNLTKQIYENRPEIKEKRKLNKKDAFAIGLTLIVVVFIGVILWFIPFTNGWMREVLFENPISQMIGNLFK